MPHVPNVLFLIADDHRYDLLSGAGHPVVRTPNLDALISRGVRFTHHHCQGGMTMAICAPSRASILSGRELFGATASIEPGDRATNDLNPDALTLPQVLREHGYHTHAIGKWHNGRAAFKPSFDSGDKLFFGAMSDHRAVPVHTFDPTGTYDRSAATVADGFSTDVFADAAIDFLGKAGRNKPFFCWVAFTAPHDPRTPPPDFAAWYDPGTIPLPSNFRTSPPDTGHLDVRDELLAAFPRDPAEVRQHIADYYGMISHLDHGIGRILDSLTENDLADDTVVIYTSDHGLAVGHHGLMGKQNLYDHSVRVPLIVAGPGLPAGVSVDALSLHADLFPTIAELAEVEVPETVQGFSLGDLLHDPGSDGPRRVVHAAYLNLARMASDGGHKLIRYYGDASRTEVYDLVGDPGETEDRSSDPHAGEVAAQLRSSLDAWQDWSGDPLAGALGLV